GVAVGRDGRDQSRVERADRLGLVRRLADRVRPHGRLRRRARGAGGHRADTPVRRACARRGDRSRAMTRLIVAVLAAALTLTGCAGLPGRPRPDAREAAPTETRRVAPLYGRNWP